MTLYVLKYTHSLYYHHIFVDFYCLFRWFLCCLFRAQTYYNDPELRQRVSGAGATAGVVNTAGTHTSTASITKPVFPPSTSDVWSTDVMALPSINVRVLFQYLCVCEQQSMGGDTPALTQKPLHRGYQFYYWSYIQNVRICLLPEKEQGVAVHLLTSQCWASQRKQLKYVQELKLVECVSNVCVRLDYASCACPAGVGGGCQHIAALFFTVEKCRLTVAERLPGPETCTSLERAWVPRQRDISPKPLSDVTVERPRTLALCTATEPQSKRSCEAYAVRLTRGSQTCFAG